VWHEPAFIAWVDGDAAGRHASISFQ
ncbi:uncharacterized protein METZ01_LOCUS54334, partial [marine metagenome]